MRPFMFINKNTSIVCSTYCEGYNNTQYYYYESIIIRESYTYCLTPYHKYISIINNDGAR